MGLVASKQIFEDSEMPGLIFYIETRVIMLSNVLVSLLGGIADLCPCYSYIYIKFIAGFSAAL